MKTKIWSSIKKKFDTTKWECQKVLKALKKVKYWLYKVRFILETNIRVLVTQLNQLDIDLSGALIT